MPAMQETWVQSLGWEDPWRSKWLPTSVLLPGESHGQRSLMAYRPWITKSRTQLSGYHSGKKWQEKKYKYNFLN